MIRKVKISKIEADTNLAFFWDEKGRRYVDPMYQGDYVVGDTIVVKCNRYRMIENVMED